MSRAPDRRPSTLAVGRAIAATKPLNAIPMAPRKPGSQDPSLAPKSATGTHVKPTATSASSAAASAASKGSATPSATRSRATKAPPRVADTASGETRVLFTVVTVFLVCAISLASVRVAGSMREGRSREAMASTFVKLHAQQQNFRLLNARFATWSELEAAGATLEPRQRLVASNADASHWFMRLSDTDAGVVCDRTGELFDESADERKPVCRALNP